MGLGTAAMVGQCEACTLAPDASAGVETRRLLDHPLKF